VVRWGAILGSEVAVGSLTATKKREYRVTNKLHEGKRPLYAIFFNFLDARYYDVFASAGGNRVCIYLFFSFFFWSLHLHFGSSRERNPMWSSALRTAIYFWIGPDFGENFIYGSLAQKEKVKKKKKNKEKRCR
jgi:hypothetical protein